MVESGDKVPDLPWTRVRPICRRKAGSECARAEEWLGGVCILCGLVLFIAQQEL